MSPTAKLPVDALQRVLAGTMPPILHATFLYTFTIQSLLLESRYFNHCIKPPKTGRDLFWEA